MLELFAYDFMQRSLLAAAMVGGLCSVIGVFVVLRGLAFMGAGTAHAAFAGVALGFLMGWPPLLMALLFGLATVWTTGWMEEKGRMKLDASIGILYTATMALAILFIGLMKTYNAEVYGYLFGNVLAVTSEELGTIAGLSVVVIGTIVLFSKELYFIAFDQEMAEASGIPARRRGEHRRHSRDPMDLRVDADPPDAHRMAGRGDRVVTSCRNAEGAGAPAPDGARMAVLRRPAGQDRDGVRQDRRGDRARVRPGAGR